MKRQLLSAALLSTATLGTSCAATLAPPPPQPFVCSVTEIGQGQRACESLLTAFESGSVATYKEAELECRRITAKLRISFGDDAYEDAYQQACLEVWKRRKATNIYRLIEWRLHDLAGKHRRLGPLPDELEQPRHYSTLLRDPKAESHITENCWLLGQIAEKRPDVFAGHPHGALARSIVVLWSEQPEAWCAGEKKPRRFLTFLIGEASARLGISRKDAERGIRAWREIAGTHFRKDFMS